MAATVQNLRPAEPVPPARSPDRQRLATAIERLAECRADLSRLAEARAKVEPPWRVAAEVAEAQAALDEARAAEPARLVDVLLGEAQGADPTAAAEAALLAAEAKLDRARQVRTLLDERERAASAAVEAAERDVKAARAAVLKSSAAVAALIAGHREALRLAAEIAACLSAVGATSIRYEDRNWDTLVHEFKPTDLPAAAAWVAAVAALATDPDAGLPGDAAAPQPPPNAA